MAPKTIILKGDPLIKEDPAGGAITPGHLITFSGANVVVHASAGQNAAPDFALESDLEAREIGTAYASTQRVQHAVFRPGDEVYALLAAGESVTKGDSLESNGDGCLRKHTPGTLDSAEIAYVGAIVARALEDKDAGSSGGSDVRIKAEVV